MRALRRKDQQLGVAQEMEQEKQKEVQAWVILEDQWNGSKKT